MYVLSLTEKVEDSDGRLSGVLGGQNDQFVVRQRNQQKSKH